MKTTEAAMLCRYVQACCPQQKFDEFTPDAWFDLLGDLPFDVAKIGAREVAKNKPFVSPAEIRTALKRIRGAVRYQIRYREWKIDNVFDDPELAQEIGDDWVTWIRGKVDEVAAEADRRIAAGYYSFDDVNITGPEFNEVGEPAGFGSVTRRGQFAALERFERLALEAS